MENQTHASKATGHKFGIPRGSSSIIVFGVGGVCLALAQGFRQGGTWSALSPIVILVTIGLVALYVSVSVLGILFMVGSRGIKSRLQPDVVLNIARRKDIEKAFAQIERHGLQRLPFCFYLVAGKQGLSLRAGPSTYAVLTEFTWDQIESIKSALLPGPSRPSRGVILSVSTDKKQVELPFVILGRGFAGTFPLSNREITSTLERLSALSKAYTSGGRRP
ncbi:hypothetical protein GCM10011399_31220 [Subtercola lobariae]|uniref:Uncharacterized protein n=1 Tax=Subtercola lobariae TaxID=1588641 RepID=A0A917BBL4_9MICO|nr:hypothetical protein GCM10011399_31220 [Subtercola lobariae]